MKDRAVSGLKLKTRTKEVRSRKEAPMIDTESLDFFLTSVSQKIHLANYESNKKTNLFESPMV